MNANGIALVVLIFVAILDAVVLLHLGAKRRKASEPRGLYDGVSARTAWDIAGKDRPYPCLSVWMTRNGDAEADRRILEILASRCDRKRPDTADPERRPRP